MQKIATADVHIFSSCISARRAMSELWVHEMSTMNGRINLLFYGQNEVKIKDIDNVFYPRYAQEQLGTIEWIPFYRCELSERFRKPAVLA